MHVSCEKKKASRIFATGTDGMFSFSKASFALSHKENEQADGISPSFNSIILPHVGCVWKPRMPGSHLCSRPPLATRLFGIRHCSARDQASTRVTSSLVHMSYSFCNTKEHIYMVGGQKIIKRCLELFSSVPSLVRKGNETKSKSASKSSRHLETNCER